MSIESVSAVDADLARIGAAQLQLAAVQAHEHPGGKPNEVEHDHAAVQAAEATLAQAEAALHADQAATSAAAPVHHLVTDPGGIVV